MKTAIFWTDVDEENTAIMDITIYQKIFWIMVHTFRPKYAENCTVCDCVTRLLSDGNDNSDFEFLFRTHDNSQEKHSVLRHFI